MNAKEQWIERTLESLEGISRGETDPFLYEKVMHRMKNLDESYGELYPRMIWKVAAVILLLISFNIITLVYYNHSFNGIHNNIQSIVSDYFSYLDTLKI